MSGLITIRVIENGVMSAEETIVAEDDAIHTITKGFLVYGEKVELEMVFDPPVQFRTADEQQEVEN